MRPSPILHKLKKRWNFEKLRLFLIRDYSLSGVLYMNFDDKQPFFECKDAFDNYTLCLK